MPESSMVSLYSLLLQSSGLSAHEAASLHEVSDQTVIAWSSGNAAPSEKALQYLYRLIDLQNHAARWLLHALTEGDHAASHARVTLCVTDDIYESGTLGWPTPSAMNAAVRRLLEMADDNLRSRIQLAFNPGPNSDVCYLSIRLRPDGTPMAPGETSSKPDDEDE
jgi:hypothetical protein